MKLKLFFLALTIGVLFGELAFSQDWTMRGGSSHRNNTPQGKNIADDWDVGRFDRELRTYVGGRNIKWQAPLGSQSYGNPVVADGRVFVGSNNGAGYLKRFPSRIDLGVVICFREADGKFLWQHSNEKLATGRVHDWPMQGVCSTPLIEENRLWYVSNRGEVVCLDTEGFGDKEDDGPIVDEHVRLFKADALLESGLKRRFVSQRLRDAFAGAGVELPRSISVSFDWKKPGPWKISRYDRTLPKGKQYVPIFEIDRKGDQLVAHQLSNDALAKRTMQLFTIDNALFPGLAMSDVDPNLQKLFAERGFELPKRVMLKTLEPEKRWSFAAVVNGSERSFELSIEKSALSCFSHLTPGDTGEADVVWRFNMMKELGTSQHNMANCSPISFGKLLFVCTSNGVDETHLRLPTPEAPSFIALDKSTGKVVWTDASPGKNILHGQWSSPAVGVFDGVPQVIFPGGDGWVYSFRADKWDKKNQKPILLWKFDGNPKASKWTLGGRGTRNNIIAMPVIYDSRVYIAMGQDPEHGEGDGHLWCLDPAKRGDVSAELAVKLDKKMRVPLPPRRLQAVKEEDGELAIANPNSAVIWHYHSVDHNKNGEMDFEETFHRTLSMPAVKNNLLFIADFSGLMHCLDAKTGRVHWMYDMLAACWGSPLIVDDKVYIGDEDGDLTIFQLSADPARSFAGKPLKNTPHCYDEARQEIMMDNSVYTTPMVANGTLFITNRSHLFAIEKPAK